MRCVGWNQCTNTPGQAIIKYEQNRTKYRENNSMTEYEQQSKSWRYYMLKKKHNQPLLSYPYDWHCWQFHWYYQQHLYIVNCSIASSHQWHRQLYAVVNASIICAPHNTTADTRLLIKYQRISATVALHHFPQLKMQMIIMRNKFLEYLISEFRIQ